MRIAYVVNHDFSKDDGVSKKVRMQVREWERLGAIVRVYSTKSRSRKTDGNFHSYKSHSRFLLNKSLITDIDTFEPTILYYRYSSWGLTLSYLVKTYTSIVEVNTNEEEEFWLLFKKQKNMKSLMLYLANKYLRRILISNTNGVVGVTNELAMLPCNSRYCEDIIGIPNGIDLNEYITKKEIINNSKLGVFFMGTPNQPWHGVDYIVKLANRFKQYDFHIVGINGESEDNVFYHGYLKEHEYVDVLKQCHICVGSLALFRNGMKEGSPLKVREYIAYGFPVLVGYQDSSANDTVNNSSWYLKIDFSNFENQKEIIFKSFLKFAEESKYYILGEDEKYFFSSSYTESKRLDYFIEHTK